MAAASSSASQPAEPVDASQLDMIDVWTRIQKLGHFPKRHFDPQTESEQEEQRLWSFLYKSKARIPDGIWQEMRAFGAVQPVNATQQLVDDIKRFGRYPIENKKG